MADDLELLRGFVERAEEGAFGEVVGRNARWMFAAAYRQVRDVQVAEDVVQGVFVLLAQRAGKVVRGGNVAGWLFLTVQNVVRNVRRSELARKRREVAAAAMVREREVVMADVRELAEVLDGAVEKLPGKYREAVVMRFYREMEFGEVAAALGTSEAGARKRVERGVEMLRGKLGAGVSAGALSAGVLHGVSFAPAGLGETAARVALGAKAGVAVPAGVSAGTKGAVMAAKVKIAAAVVLVGAVAVPTVVVVERMSGPVVAVRMPVVESAPAAGAASAGGKFTVSAETTGIVSPVRGDGRPDYVAALNEMYSKGVTPAENAYVGWIELTGASDDVMTPRIREQVLQMCGAKVAGTGMKYVAFIDVLKRQGLDRDQAAIDSDLAAERRVWKEGDYPAVAAWVKANEAFLDAQAGVWRRPRYWFPAVADKSGSVFAVLLPGLGVMRETGNALTARAMLRAGRGDFEGFLSDLETVQRMARRVGSSYTGIEVSVGFALDGMASRAAGAAAGSGILTKEQCERLGKVMEGLEPVGSVGEKMTRMERYSLLDIELLVATGGLDLLRGTLNEEDFAKQFGVFETVDVAAVNWDQVLRDSNGLFDAEVGVMNAGTVAELRSEMKRTLQAQHVNRKSLMDLSKDNGESTEAYSKRVEEGFAGMLVADFTGMGTIERQTKMLEEMARGVVEAARFKAENGKWPEELKGLPVDVYSKSGTDLVKYVVGEAGVRVYSVGRNGVDEGGVAGRDDLVVGVIGEGM